MSPGADGGVHPDDLAHPAFDHLREGLARAEELRLADDAERLRALSVLLVCGHSTYSDPGPDGRRWCVPCQAFIPEAPDFRGLLKRYLAHVHRNEGAVFVEFAVEGPCHDLDEGDVALLTALCAEVGLEPPAPVNSTWAVSGECVVVVALTGHPSRVWVETGQTHPKDRRRFIAALGALKCQGSGAEPISRDDGQRIECRFCGEPWNLLAHKPSTSIESGRSVMQDHGGPS